MIKTKKKGKICYVFTLALMCLIVFTTGFNNITRADDYKERFSAQLWAYSYACTLSTGVRNPYAINLLIKKADTIYKQAWVQYIFAVGLERGYPQYLKSIDIMKEKGYWSDEYVMPELVIPSRTKGGDGAWTYSPLSRTGDCTAYTKSDYESWTLFLAETDSWKLKTGCTPSTCKIDSIVFKSSERSIYVIYYDDEKGEFVRTNQLIENACAYIVYRDKATYEALKDCSIEEYRELERYISNNWDDKWPYGEAPNKNIVNFIKENCPDIHLEYLTGNEEDKIPVPTKKVTPTPEITKKPTVTPTPKITKAVTPTATPSPVPTKAEATPVPSEIPESTATPSPVPTEADVTPVPSEIIEPTATPSLVPTEADVTPVPSEITEPTVTPSIAPTEVPEPTAIISDEPVSTEAPEVTVQPREEDIINEIVNTPVTDTSDKEIQTPDTSMTTPDNLKTTEAVKTDSSKIEADSESGNTTLIIVLAAAVVIVIAGTIIFIKKKR